MFLHVLALFLHTFFMAFFQICRCVYFKNPTAAWEYIWNWSRLGMYVSGDISEVIVVYLFLEFSKPVALKNEVKDDDSDYEEEFDRVRDPNADMMFYVKNMPKLKRNETVDLEIDESKGANLQLFDSREEGEDEDAEFAALENDA
jgi:hypothetical protein